MFSQYMGSGFLILSMHFEYYMGPCIWNKPHLGIEM